MKSLRSRWRMRAARAFVTSIALIMSESPSLALAQDAAAGKTKAQMCTPCHGPVGISVQPDAPNLAGQP